MSNVIGPKNISEYGADYTKLATERNKLNEERRSTRNPIKKCILDNKISKINREIMHSSMKKY